MSRPRVQLGARLRAAKHELSCRECRVTWRSWWLRLANQAKGYTP